MAQSTKLLRTGMRRIRGGALVVLAAAMVAAAAPAAMAQSTMIKGKVVGQDGKAAPNVTITIEFMGGVNRKLQTKTDKRGEFIQLLTDSGPYKVTATLDKVGSQSVDVRVRNGAATEVNINLAPGAAATGPARATVSTDAARMDPRRRIDRTSTWDGPRTSTDRPPDATREAAHRCRWRVTFTRRVAAGWHRKARRTETGRYIGAGDLAADGVSSPPTPCANSDPEP